MFSTSYVLVRNPSKLYHDTAQPQHIQSYKLFCKSPSTIKSRIVNFLPYSHMSVTKPVYYAYSMLGRSELKIIYTRRLVGLICMRERVYGSQSGMDNLYVWGNMYMYGKTESSVKKGTQGPELLHQKLIIWNIILACLSGIARSLAYIPPSGLYLNHRYKRIYLGLVNFTLVLDNLVFCACTLCILLHSVRLSKLFIKKKSKHHSLSLIRNADYRCFDVSFLKHWT